jgi:hypothetical protein
MDPIPEHLVPYFPSKDAPMLDGAHDLGSEHWFLWWLKDGVEIGVVEYHPTPAGGRCAGSVLWSGPEAKHTLVQREPLTLSPSLACGQCGQHGYIRDGRWVPA